MDTGFSGDESSNNSFINESFNVQKKYQTINKESKHRIKGVPTSTIDKQDGLLEKELQRKISDLTLNAKIRLNHMLLKMKSLSNHYNLGKTINIHIGNLISDWNDWNADDVSKLL